MHAILSARSVPVSRVAVDDPSSLAVVDELLRDPDALLARIERGENLRVIARAMLMTVILAGLAFGAALGISRGSVQIALAGTKLPLAVLLTAAICSPVLTTMNRVLLGQASLRRDVARVLACLARGTLAAAALAPLVVLAACADVGYHRMILVAAACAAMSGLVGAALFLRSVRAVPQEERRFLVITVLATFSLVGAQLTWTMRPFVTRPQSGIVLVRPLQGNVIDALSRTVDSALGIYPAEIREAK